MARNCEYDALYTINHEGTLKRFKNVSECFIQFILEREVSKARQSITHLSPTSLCRVISGEEKKISLRLNKLSWNAVSIFAFRDAIIFAGRPLRVGKFAIADRAIICRKPREKRSKWGELCFKLDIDKLANFNGGRLARGANFFPERI